MQAPGFARPSDPASAGGAVVDGEAAGEQRTTIYLNGKFTAQHLTGTQRVAREVTLAIDRLLAEDPRTAAALKVVLLCPVAGDVPPLEHIEVRRIASVRVSLHVWEQFHLARHVRGGLLMSLSGSAPMLVRRQFSVIHDAAVFERSQAYTLQFLIWYRLLFRSLARRSERLFTVSHFSRERLEHHLRLRGRQLEVLPNGADHLDGIEPDAAALQRFGLRGGDYLLAVGGANPNKNIPRLRQAFEKATRGRELKLVIVGGMNRKVFGAESAGAFSFSDRIVITGPVDDPTLKAFYGSAVALIYPSTYEGFGIPPLEAMNCGCPVLASDAAAIPDVCGSAALYFDPYSVDSIEQAIRRVLDEQGLRDDLVTRGLRHAATFKWRATAQALLEKVAS